MIQVRIIFILVIQEEAWNNYYVFPWAGARQGIIGDGQVGITSYVVPKGTMEFWENRLEKFDVPYTKMTRFGEQYIEFDDPHGLHIELVEREEGELNNWTFGKLRQK